MLRDHIGPLVRTAPPPRAADAAGIDVVLLSHLHYDHTDLPSLARLGAGEETAVVAPRGAGRWLEEQGLHDVRELGTGEETAIGPLTIAATPAVHDGRRRPLGVRAQPVGFVVSGSSSVYFAGDTDLFPGMADMTGAIDVALLPVAGWGPTLGAGHLDPARAATAAALIAPRLAVPIHWGTFALWPRRLRPVDPERPARDFAALAAHHAPDVEVRVVAPADETEMPVRVAGGAR